MLSFHDQRYLSHPPSFVWMEDSDSVGGRNLWSQHTSDLIREIARLGWTDVPGVDVTVWLSGSGRNVTMNVWQIAGTVPEVGPFRIVTQGAHDVMEVAIGGKEMAIHSDGSGHINLYVGSGWESDGADWIARSKVNAKLNGEPKTHLYYRQDPHQPNLFHHDTDLGRAHDRAPDEPKTLSRAQVIKEQCALLERLVHRLRAEPTPIDGEPGAPLPEIIAGGAAKLIRLLHQEPIPAPDAFPTLFTTVESRQAWRIRRAQAGLEREDKRDLECALSGGRRLCGLGVPNPKDNPFPEIAYDGFVYGYVSPQMKREGCYTSSSKENLPALIRPKILNDVFVFDDGAYAVARDALWARVRAVEPERKTLTDAEVAQVDAAVARTLVPAAEYMGGYANPVYAIRREIGFDEVEVVIGPVFVVCTHGKVRVEAGEDQILLAEYDDSAWSRKHAAQIKERIEADIAYMDQEFAADLAARAEAQRSDVIDVELSL